MGAQGAPSTFGRSDPTMFDERGAHVTIQLWEYALLLVYIIAFSLYFGRKQRHMVARNPEYKYYLPGFYARLFGSLCLIWIYMYYYKNGDVISFFISAVPVAKLLPHDPEKFFEMFFLPNTWDNYRYLFDPEIGYPLGYVYVDGRTYFLVKVVALLVLVSFNSIVITSVLVSVVTYGGIWNFYQMLVRYYPLIPGRLAIATLFFPSCVFWGSGILKDTFAFSAACWFVYSLDRIFFLKKGGWRSWLNLVVSAWIMIAMKPYVFMTIFPAALLWILYQRVQRFRNALVRVLFLPAVMATLAAGTVFVMDSLGGRLGKFSLDSALETVVINQADMKRSAQYGSNYFDIGEVQATWSSVLGKFPQASFAGMYRPQLIECNNIVMVLAGMENTFLLLLTLYILFRTRVVYFITLLVKNPLLQMCYVFAIGYAFMIGVTTPNFGALVRFKIPMLPFLVAGLFITNHILDRRQWTLSRGKKFNFESFTNGDPERRLTKVELKVAQKPKRR